ncbi:putative ribonuclease H-like domain-containing protein [Tanacetum coccineum]
MPNSTTNGVAVRERTGLLLRLFLYYHMAIYSLQQFTPGLTIDDKREVQERKNKSLGVTLSLASYSFNISLLPLTTDDKREGPREEEQVFMDDLERLKRQEKEANEEAEALRKKFAQETENLIIQEGAAKPSSTNIFSTVSTPAKASSTNLVNIVSLPVSTASPHEGLSLSDPTNPEEDDSEIPPLEDIYQNSTDGIFTTSFIDDDGCSAFDFTNLETVVNVSPIPTSRIHSSHPSALILGDPNSAVQTRSKYTSLELHALLAMYKKQKRELTHKDFHHLSRYRSLGLSRICLMEEGYRLLGHRQEEGIGLVEVFASVARLEAIKDLFSLSLIYGLLVSSMDVKSALLYEKIDEEYLMGNQMGSLVSRVSSFDWSPTQISDYVEQIMTEFNNREFVNFLGRRTHFLAMQEADHCGYFFSPTEAEYVAAASCCGQVLWIQNQMLDYGFNFMNTKIYIDNESTICLFKNPSIYSKTKHIAIRHHFIRDAYEKKLIQVLKIHTDDNVADLLTKAMMFAGFVIWLFLLGAVSSSALHSLGPNLSPRPSPTTTIPDSIPETSGENLGGHSSSDKSLSGNEGDMTLQSVYDLCLSLFCLVS